MDRKRKISADLPPQAHNAEDGEEDDVIGPMPDQVNAEGTKKRKGRRIRIWREI